VPGLAQILGSSDGYNSQKHVWTIPNRKLRRAVEFGAFETPKEAEAYQGRAADLIGFDEAVQFQEAIVRFIIGWNRTAIPNQRCRAVLASNPPLTPEGLWIFEWFAPWLDPEHPNPAKPGELRYFVHVGGHDIEVAQDYVGTVVDANGNEMEVRPKSRTFIPASLSDNPDLLDSGYASQLANLPDHLQRALLQGKFTTTLEDSERQVIPAEWILKAQARWSLRKQLLVDTPMTALGVDVADGGADRMVCVPLHGVVFGEPRIKAGVDVKSTEAKVAMVVNAAKDDPQMNIDCGGGYGGGLSDTLETNGFNVVRCKGAEASIAMDRTSTRGFANKRAEWIWRLREGLD
ncbi:MAG: terminase, partial [Gammaproteobacteria bacterium]